MIPIVRVSLPIARIVDEQRIAFACSAAALVVCGVAVAASIEPYGWSPTVLVRMSATEPLAAIAAKADPGFRFVPTGSHYDGVYYYAIARDPLALDELQPLIDRPAYRYGHPGYGWLAGAVSLGRTAWIPNALLAINLLAVAVAAFAASVLARAYDLTPWGGLVVAFNPGIVYAVTADGSEPLALTLLLLALLAWTRRRWLAAGVVLLACCLTKEPLLVVPAGLAIWEAIRRPLRLELRDVLQRAAALAVGPFFFALWYWYLRADFGHFPPSEARDLTSRPFKGWIDAFRLASRLESGDFNTAQIGAAAVALLAVVGGLLLLALILAVRFRTPIDAVFVGIALVGFSLNWWGLLYTKDLVRELALPLTLAPAVLALGLRPSASARTRR